MPLVAMFLNDQIWFNSRENFCQIIFNADHGFYRKRSVKFLIVVYKGHQPRALAAMIFTDHIYFSFFF